MSKAEMWKDIKGFENRYEISSFGNVKKIFTKSANFVITTTPKGNV